MFCLHATAARINQLYALSGMPQRTERQSPTQDQLIYSPLEDIFTIWQCSPDKFRISYANTDFKLCASYPEAAIVPKVITDEDLRKVKQSKISAHFMKLDQTCQIYICSPLSPLV